jgi:NTP pyrophosphatase (non-canonical NTP hydrolase)
VALIEDLSHLGLTLLLAHLPDDTEVQVKREKGSPWVCADVVEPFTIPVPPPPARPVLRTVASYAIWKATGNVYRIGSDSAVEDDPFLEPEGLSIPFQTSPNVRPEVAWFATQMEKRLRENDHKPGWKSESPVWLVERAGDEHQELYNAVSSRSGPDGWVVREAADVANFAMMVADVATEGEEKTPPLNMGNLIAWLVEAYDDGDDPELRAAMALARRAFNLPSAREG